MSETKEHTHKDNTNSSFSTLITGIVVGAALTYLFTTESGRKIKDELLKEGTKLVDGLGDEIEKANTKAQETKEEFTEEVSKKKKELEVEIHEAAQSVKNQIKTVQEDVAEITEVVPQQVEQIQKKGRRFFFAKKSSPHES